MKNTKWPNRSCVQRVVRVLIEWYQFAVSPWLGPRCRFFPSCSDYAKGCFEQHGFWDAAVLTVRRVMRCHPWNQGGVDYPPVCQKKEKV